MFFLCFCRSVQVGTFRVAKFWLFAVQDNHDDDEDENDDDDDGDDDEEDEKELGTAALVGPPIPDDEEGM